MKSILLASLACLFVFHAFSQNNPPVAVDDTVGVISQVPALIDALANDYDPDGDNFYIEWYLESSHYSLDTNNNQFIFKSGNSLDETGFRYKIKDDGTPAEISESARVRVNIIVNPEVPVAYRDTFDVLELIPVELDVMVNDLDQNGDNLTISGLSSFHHCDAFITDDFLHVMVIPDLYYSGYAHFSYFVRESGTPEGYMSDWVLVQLNVSHNPDLPVALPDTSYTTGGIPVSIHVLENDYDPQGEEIEIFQYSAGGAGTTSLSGNEIIYTPSISFAGIGGFSYNVRETADTNIYSEYTHDKIYVAKNPDCPVGVADLASGMTFSPITIDVLTNDFDVNGDPIELWDVESNGSATISGNEILYTSDPLTYDLDTLYYRIRQVNDTLYYSEWTPVYITLAQNPLLPVAVNDYYTARSVFPISISPLVNDIMNSADSLRIYKVNSTSKGDGTVVSDSLITYQAYTNVSQQDSLEYFIIDKNNEDLKGKGKIYIGISDHHYYDSLTINKINAGVNADGMLFGNSAQIPGIGLEGDLEPHFKYPNGAETNTILNSIIWIGGISDDDSLHYAGEEYRQWGADFQPGPVSEVYDSNYAFRFWKLWKLSKAEIDYHRNHWSQAGFQPIADILSWPGNGDVSSGQAANLAPYSDFNLDGIYDPTDGDYPLIRGDQSIYFIMNDDKEHTETEGNKLKIEIHGMVYGFDKPDDSALYSTVFVHYDLVNRSEKVYHEMYAGVFTDFDLGNFWDDNVGSEVSRASYYCYNGDAFDEDLDDPYYSTEGYGEYPPAQSVTILAGPFIDADEADNPAGGCDYSVNGLNFGNGNIDDERFGLIRFINLSFSTTEQEYAPYYYNLFNGIWHDNTRLQFGGNGHISDPRAAGPDCNFMYPGDSDPLNWGTGCVPPNEPYNQEGYYWTDSSENISWDRRSLGVMGPFTFKPGDVQEIELAYCVANGWDGPVSSINKLMEYIDSLRYRVNQGEIIVPNDQLGMNESRSNKVQVRIFPNPAIDRISFKLEGIENSGSEFVIYDVFGRMAASGKLMSGSKNTIDISYFKPGFYFISVKSVKMIYSGKFIKR